MTQTTEELNVRKRSRALAVLLVPVMVSPAAPALASNVSHPATYIGTASTGGTVEFDISPDGTEMIRFALKKVPFPPCGIVSSRMTVPIADIVDDSFSKSKGLLHFSGTFPAIQQAQGTLSFRRSDGSCNSQDVSWTATTPTPPPDETPPTTKIKSGPSGTVRRQMATFRFTSTEIDSTFLCRFDRRPWRSCESPKIYRNLKESRHVFKVKATDGAGNSDPTPAKRRWRVELG
jgi:hypothetical protein